MKRYLIASALLAGAAFAIAHMARLPFPVAVRAAPADPASDEEADRAAIMKTARDFEAAFNKHDARTIAAMWTKSGECREASGKTFLGQAAIEKGYAAFFTANAGA